MQTIPVPHERHPRLRYRQARRLSVGRLVWMAGAAAALALVGSVAYFPAVAQDAETVARPASARGVHVADLTSEPQTLSLAQQQLKASPVVDGWPEPHAFAAASPAPDGNARTGRLPTSARMLPVLTSMFLEPHR